MILKGQTNFVILYVGLLLSFFLGSVLCSAMSDNQQNPTPSSDLVTQEKTNPVLQYMINKTWDGQKPLDDATINLSFTKASSENKSTLTGLLVEIDAPFYNDPIVPSSVPVGSTDKLWDYEVVEVFFLSESEEMYLETEFSPSGHYLLLQLDTKRNVLKYQLPLENYSAEVKENGRWHGKAVIPLEYLPKNVNKFNAYAIHKSDPDRVYMSLFPTPKGRYSGPDFHRLNYFQAIDLNSLLHSQAT